jgi:HlyD family secretion protein
MKRKIVTGPRIIGALIMIALAIAVGFALRKPPVSVDLGEVTRGPLTVTVDDLGETRVTNLYVVSAPVTGELLRVPLKPGDRVVARTTILGHVQPLAPAPLDARNVAQNEANVRALTAQLAAASARVAEAQAEQRLAEHDYARIEPLARQGFVSQANADRARTARERARAAAAEAGQSADAARHSLDAARAALIVSGTRSSGRGAVAVTSPVSGYVMRVPQESERVVVAGTPLVEIGDADRLEMVTDLLSADAVRVRPGAAVLIEDWGGDRPLHGRVRLVEPFGFTKISALGVEEQRVNVVVDFAEPRQALVRLGHGYRATLRIAIWSAPNLLRVPISALFRADGRWSVFVVDDDGKARLAHVEVGHMNDELAEIGGLQAGTRLILHPSDRIRDGVAVRGRN